MQSQMSKSVKLKKAAAGTTEEKLKQKRTVG